MWAKETFDKRIKAEVYAEKPAKVLDIVDFNEKRCSVDGLRFHDDGSVTLTLREWIEDKPSS